MKRVYIETYGCQMNVADSELMLGVLGGAGYVQADDPAEADVMLVNTHVWGLSAFGARVRAPSPQPWSRPASRSP